MRFLRLQYGKFLIIGFIIIVTGLAIYGNYFAMPLIGGVFLLIGLFGYISRRRLG